MRSAKSPFDRIHNCLQFEYINVGHMLPRVAMHYRPIEEVTLNSAARPSFSPERDACVNPYVSTSSFGSPEKVTHQPSHLFIVPCMLDKDGRISPACWG